MSSKNSRYWNDPEYREKMLAIGRAYHHAHKEEISARKSLRWKTDPEYRAKSYASGRKSYRKTFLKYTHGLSLAAYDELRARQGGVCAICNRTSERPLFVDHCHVTGLIRGLLCYRCNSGLGFCWDDPVITGALAAYLEAGRSRSHRMPPWRGFSLCRSRLQTSEFRCTAVRRSSDRARSRSAASRGTGAAPN